MSAEGSVRIGEILDLLEKTGFPLEMRAARAAQEARAEVRQSVHYTDPVENKVRETDVVATWASTRNLDLARVEVSAVIECKTKAPPWGVFTEDAFARDELPSVLFDLLPHRLHGDSTNLHDQLNMISSPSNSLLGPALIGYRIADISTGKERNSAYDAARAAVSACYGLLDSDAPDPGDPPRMAFIRVPVVVTTGELFRVWLDGSGVVRAEQAANTNVLVQSRHGPARCVIVTENALPDALAVVRATGEQVGQKLSAR